MYIHLTVLCRVASESLGRVYHRYTYVKCQSGSIRRGGGARVWANTMLGVASSRTIISPGGVIQGGTSLESLSVTLFYRDIIVESECHVVTWPTIRLVSFRRAIRRLLDISSCCYSNKNMNWDCFFDIEKKRSIYMYILWILGKKKKRNDWFMPTMNDKIIYRFIVVLIKNGKIYILEIFCIKIYSIIVFQNNGGVFEICNKSGGWFFIRFS